MIPLCAIGDAQLEVIGLNPQSIDDKSKARWPVQEIFDSEPFIQPSGLGERTITLRLAARPHIMGGLDQYAILRQHFEAQDAVLYIRLGAGLVGDVLGEVGIASLSHAESKIAPGGLGRRHEFDVELIVLGSNGAAGLIGAIVGGFL